MTAPNDTPAAPIAAAAPAVAAATPEEEGFRVYVGNLAFTATEEEVRAHFVKAGGEILSVILPTRFKSRRPAGYAFVTYKKEEDAKNAVEKLNETEIGERKISLEIARSKEENAERKAAIVAERKETKAAAKTDNEATATEGEKSGDKADKPKKKKATKTARRRGPEDGDDAPVDGEADAAKPKKATRAPKKAEGESSEKEKAEKKPKEAKEPKEPKQRKPRLELTGDVSKDTVFVANLPFSVDDEGLTELFTKLDIKVKSANVIRGLRRLPGRRPFHGSKGFGFVELADPTQQQEAVDKINGSSVGDRKVTAKIAQEMKPIELAEATGEAAKEESKEVKASA
ncbi:Single-stranded TG1-3 DNA-binding protein [Vanrija pseudolonga]|uniref:Single-stranded TG1-3 DNA-binding protein n=1 Tax=Vanrija pseudolonga TaxID=143232 RepID=A0AAF0YCH7_9TREE|nr:Single-stranded TG1-3 DNA-binding protein [Vanrija pseudolonga]